VADFVDMGREGRFRNTPGSFAGTGGAEVMGEVLDGGTGAFDCGML
jgi:hypothetical protein